MHPVFDALAFLAALQIRFQRIQEALNVIEHWNNVNDFIRFGKGGDFATNQRNL